MADSNKIPDFSGLHPNRFFAAAESEGLIKLDPYVAVRYGFGISNGQMLFDPFPQRLEAFLGLREKISPGSRSRLVRLGEKAGYKNPSAIISRMEQEASRKYNKLYSEELFGNGSYLREQQTEVYKQLKTAGDWKKATGLNPVYISSATEHDPKVILNHEDIHVAHFGNPNHPYIKELENTALPFKKALLSSGEKPELIERLDQHYKRSWEAMKQTSEELSEKAEKSERIAFANQNDSNFLAKAEALGVKTRQSEARRLQSVVQDVMKTAETQNPAGWASKFLSGARKMSKAL